MAEGAKKISKPMRVGLIILALIVAIQLIPINRTNPPVTYNVKWDSPKTESYFKRACADCHSNETVWPWTSYIAPFKFMISSHVSEGRDKFNISDGNMRKADEAGDEYARGKMPVPGYTMMHSNAKLTPAEREEFLTGLRLTFGKIQEKSEGVKKGAAITPKGGEKKHSESKEEEHEREEH